MAQAAASSCSNSIVHVLLWVLAAIESISRHIFYTWHRLRVGPGKARPGGSNPPPPKTLGIVITETNTADISVRQVANLTAWCTMFGAQHVHLYDPSGHLKTASAVLQDSLQTVLQQEGRSFVLKCGWSVAGGSSSPPDPRQQPLQAPAAAPQDGFVRGATEQQCNGHSHQPQHQQHRKEGAAGNSSTAADIGSTAVTVRLLSSEDAYGPVIAAAQRRCAMAHSSQCSSSAAANSRQLAQGRLCHLGSNGNCSADSKCRDDSCLVLTCNGLTQPGGGHVNCNSCGQEQLARNVGQDDWAVQLSSGDRQANGTHCKGVPHCEPAAESTSCTAAEAEVSIHQSAHQDPQRPLCNGHKSQTDVVHELANGSLQQNGVCSHKPNGLARQDVADDVPCGHQQQPAAQRSRPCGLLPQQQQQQSQKLTLQTTGCSCAQQSHRHQKQEGSILPELAELVGPDVLQEPQLLLVFGPVLSLAGYPPFHTRACEVQYMGSLLDASRQSIANAIAGYCNVLQRHGA